MSNNEQIEKAMEALNKDYGKGTVVKMGEKTRDEYDIIPSGSVRLNKALGIGGFAKGRLYELRGWQGSGKTTLCGHLVAECQAAGGKVVYIDGEHAVDMTYFKKLGVDTDALLICQPSYGEEGFEVARRMIETGQVDLVIIDSDSSLLPKSVIDGEIGDSAIGKKARLNSDAYPKLKLSLTRHNACVVVISQYREKIGVMFGNPTTTQGGHALKFYSDCILEMSASASKEGTERIGNETKVKITKNKMSSPFTEASFDIRFGIGIDKEKEVIDMAIESKVIQKSGSWYSYGETKIGQGEAAVKAFLHDNPELMEEVKSKL